MSRCVLPCLLLMGLMSEVGAEPVGNQVLGGVWAGEHSCKGHQRNLVVYFEQDGRQATAIFSTTGKKKSAKVGQYQLGVDVVVDPSGTYKVVMQPKYWLDNPGKGRMVGFRGEFSGTTLTGKVSAKGCKKFRLERLPCEKVPQACSAAALGPLHAHLPPQMLALYGVPGAEGVVPVIAAPIPVPATPEVQRPAPGDKPMSKRSFAKLVVQIENQSFKRKRVNAIERASKRHFFTCSQLAQMLGVLSFKGERVRAVEAVVPRIVDPENSGVVMDSLTFRDEKRKAEAAFNKM